MKQGEVSRCPCCWNEGPASPPLDVFELSLPSYMWHRAEAFSLATEKGLKAQNTSAVAVAPGRGTIHEVL